MSREHRQPAEEHRQPGEEGERAAGRARERSDRRAEAVGVDPTAASQRPGGHDPGGDTTVARRPGGPAQPEVVSDESRVEGEIRRRRCSSEPRPVHQRRRPAEYRGDAEGSQPACRCRRRRPHGHRATTGGAGDGTRAGTLVQVSKRYVGRRVRSTSMMMMQIQMNKQIREQYS